METQHSFLKNENTKKKVVSITWKIFVDGASRGNPGPAGAGIFIKKNDITILKEGIFLGEKTNNQAEYLALALACFFLTKTLIHKNSQQHIVTIISDSELLVKQMNGLYKVKNPILRQIRTFIISLLEGLECTFTHVLRSENKIADELANIGINKKNGIPTKFLELLKKYNIDI
jgi:ribonuclease HI